MDALCNHNVGSMCKETAENDDWSFFWDEKSETQSRIPLSHKSTSSANNEVVFFARAISREIELFKSQRQTSNFHNKIKLIYLPH